MLMLLKEAMCEQRGFGFERGLDGLFEQRSAGRFEEREWSEWRLISVLERAKKWRGFLGNEAVDGRACNDSTQIGKGVFKSFLIQL